MISKTSFVIIGIVAAAGYSAAVFYLGSKSGAEAVQKEWTAENAVRDKRTRELENKNSQLEADNKIQSTKTSLELTRNAEDYAKNLAAVRADYTQRLFKSETRSGIYRQQAEGTTAERERLASHAAGLDASLEEGRLVVEELRRTLELRDKQLKLLGQQLITDRALLN